MTAAHGDEFAEYAAASIPSLRRLALLLCRNWHDADDLVQATLSKLCQHWYRAAAADSTDAYVRAILVRASVITIEDAVPGGRPLSLDLITRRWSFGPKAPVPGRQEAREFWTGSDLLVWGGGVPVGSSCCKAVKTGYSYTP